MRCATGTGSVQRARSPKSTRSASAKAHRPSHPTEGAQTMNASRLERIKALENELGQLRPRTPERARVREYIVYWVTEGGGEDDLTAGGRCVVDAIMSDIPGWSTPAQRRGAAAMIRHARGSHADKGRRARTGLPAGEHPAIPPSACRARQRTCSGTRSPAPAPCGRPKLLHVQHASLPSSPPGCGPPPTRRTAAAMTSPSAPPPPTPCARSWTPTALTRGDVCRILGLAAPERRQLRHRRWLVGPAPGRARAKLELIMLKAPDLREPESLRARKLKTVDAASGANVE